MPLCFSFCPYRGPEPAGRAMLRDWFGRARSPIAQMGPGAPKLVDRHARARVGPAIAVSRARRRLLRLYGYLPRGPGRGVDADDGTSGSQVQGAEPTRRRCQGLEVAPQTKAMTAPVMAQACGIGPAETCSPKTAATMPPNQRTEGPHNPAAPNSCMAHSRSSVAEVKFQPDHPAARSSPRGSAEPRRSARSARSPSQRA